ERLAVARHHGGVERLHPAAGVVDVVLALHPVAGEVEQVRQRVAERAGPAVGGVEDAGRVGRDELDLHPLALAELDPAVVRTGPGSQPRWSPKLRNPGGATSARATAGWAGRCRTRRWATCSGGMPAARASRIANELAYSPRPGWLERSTGGSAIEIAGRSPDC